MNCSTPGFPVHHQLPESTQTHVHRVGDAIQPCHPLLSPSPPAPNPSQHSSNFLEEICSLSHSIVFLYFFTLFIEKGFFISPCYSLLFCYSLIFPFLPCFSLLFFLQLFVKPPQTNTAFLHLFLWDDFGHWLLYNIMNLCPHFFRHSVYQIWLFGSTCHLHCINHTGFDLGHTWMTWWFSLLSSI